MKSRNVLTMLILGLSMIVCVVQNSLADSIGTAFTYQGRFIDSNSPADGSYDFEYKLYDALTGGTQLGNAIYKDNLDVIDGYFTTKLDFGAGIFEGEVRWLEIGVRPGDSTGSYTTLNPRQELTATPYAIYADYGGSGTTNYIAKFTSSNDITDSAIYESSGNVGIGTVSPDGRLVAVQKGSLGLDPATNKANSALRIINSGDTVSINFDSNQIESIGTAIYMNNGSPSNICMVVGGGNVGIGTGNPQGKLDVNGSIYQRGGLLHADYVFEQDYELESVEEHSQFMWQNGHLKAIPKAEINDDGQEVVELGAHRRGMVEELEKAHIYIEQLNERIKILEEKLARLEAKEGGAE